MKKLLIILIAVTCIAATSCKKDSETSPLKKSSSIKTFDKTVVSSWD
jgi:hypothetical protein